MHMADVPSRRRIVKCPGCSTLLVEPLETQIYECPICLKCLQVKKIPSSSLNKTLPIEISGSTASQHEASSVDNCETQGQDQLNSDETKEHTQSISQQEQSEIVAMLVSNVSIRDLSGRNGPSASKEGELATEAEVCRDHLMQQDSLDDKAVAGVSLLGGTSGDGCVSECESVKTLKNQDVASDLANEAEVSRDHLMQQDNPDDKAVAGLSFQGETSSAGLVSERASVDSTKTVNYKETATFTNDFSIPQTCTENNALAGEPRSAEETNQEEGNGSNDQNGNFESEIIRDNDGEFSFKYIASRLKPSVQLDEKKNTHRLARLSSEPSGGENGVTTTRGFPLVLPYLNNESSDDHESYSSFSESPSHDSSESEFDFPAPSVESVHSAKLSDMILHPKTPEGPHQLEWQDADLYNTISVFQESKSLTVSSVGVVDTMASDVVSRTDLEDKEELPEDGPRIKKDLVGELDAIATANVSFHAERETGFSGIEGLAKAKEKIAPERCNKVPVSVSFSGKFDCEDKERSLTDSVKDYKLKLHCDPKHELLESPQRDAENFLQLKPFSSLRGHMEPSFRDPSTSKLSEASQMKTCLMVEETGLIKNVANLGLKDSSTSSSHHNVVGTSEGVKRRDGAYFDLRNEPNSGGAQLPLVIEQIDFPQIRTESEGRHQQDHLGKGVQMHKRVDVVKMSRLKHQDERSYSSNTAQLLNSKDVATSSGTYQDQGNIHEEDLYISAASALAGSSRARDGHAHTAPMAVGPSHKLQSSQADLQFFGRAIPQMDAPSIFPASSQPFGSTNYFDGCRPIANTMCSHQVSSHPLMLPMAMPGHACSHHGYHQLGPACMPYVHGQHFLVRPQPPMQSCLLCLRTMGVHQGHCELGNFHQGLQVQAPCMLSHSPPCFTPHIAHMHDTSMATERPLMSSVVRTHKHYPPLPQGRMAPYVVCQGCNHILEVPVYLWVSGGGTQKLCCSGCGKVSKFSVLQNLAGLPSSAGGSTRNAPTSSPPSFEYMVRNRELPIIDVQQSMDSSYGKNVLWKNQAASISSRHYTANRQESLQGELTSKAKPSKDVPNNKLPTAITNGTSQDEFFRSLCRKSEFDYTGSGHQSLQGELTFKSKPSQDEPNAIIPTAITNHSSQDEFFFRSLSRKSEFDSSRNLLHGFKTMSARFGFDEVSNDAPLQCVVDEKEEGLDFGAPRPSDGESLDPESRMRSPENFESVDKPRHNCSFGGEEACWTSEIQQDFESQRIDIAQERSGMSLFTLMNQESTKFEINLDKRVPSTEPKSRVHDHTNRSSDPRNKERGRDRNVRAPHFMKKGPRYIAAMLTRSLKHQVNF